MKMKQVSVEIIHKCPNHCIHCSSFSGMDCTMKIPKEVVYGIIDGMKQIGMELLSISGGEPFLHDGLLDIVRYAKSKGIIVYIYTSGIMLNGLGQGCELENCLLTELDEAGVDRIIFDLPAIDEDVYDRFMGTNGHLKYVLNSIERTTEKGIFTEVHFVPTRINVKQIDAMLAYVEKANVNQISFLGLVPHGRAKQNSDELYIPKKENDELKRKLAEIQMDNVRIGIPLQTDNSEYQCFAGKRKLCVRYDGKVFGCEAFKYIVLYDNEGQVVEPDSIYQKSISEIYCNSLYLKAEREFVRKQMSCSDCNEKCPVQRLMRKAV